MPLAPASYQRFLAERTLDHHPRHVGGAAQECHRAVMEEFRVAHVLLVVLHVFRAPASRVRDERELRELAAELGKERQHLADHRLHVVLAAGDDERDDLVAQEMPVCGVSWFWMQFMRSIIL